MRLFSASLFIGLIIFGLSCSMTEQADKNFERIANNYLNNLIENSPEWATWLGDHRFDSLLNDLSLESINKEAQRDRDWLDSLANIDTSKLSLANRIDYDILVNGIKYSLFRNDSIKGYQKNPGMYNPGQAVYQLLAYEYAPLEERMKNVLGRLLAIPKRLDDARANLKNPPRINTETAIYQIRGTISLMRDNLNEYIDQVPELADKIKPAQAAAVTALEEYDNWLNNELQPRSTGDFRIGQELYRAKYKYVMNSDISPEDILQRARDEFEITYDELYETAVPLFKSYFSEDMFDATFSNRDKVIRMVLDHLAEDHPTADNIIQMAEEKLKECEDFVRDKKLVSLPVDPVRVIVLPEFKRGFAVAYCESPGPLEKNGETFYSISPPPADWDKNRIETYFREYNNYMLIDLTIHEAMPGHYLQADHANRYKGSTLVRALFGSGTFVEGWATYCEQLMVAQGFGGPELKMQMLKMRLRMLINVMLDQGIHVFGMTEDEAMDLMMRRGFQEEGEAAGKWRRACLSSTQLTTYYLGNIEINNIRKDYEEKAGEKINLMEFHDKLLSFGRPSPKYLRELMGL